MKLHLITYGCGDKFDFTKFRPIENVNFVKPRGGLWASPVGSRYGWREWCVEQGYGDLSISFEFDYEGNILVIDSLRAALQMPWYGYSIKYPDFEQILSLGWDAIWLTENGERETRFSQPSLYGWDCESVLIMNPMGIREEHKIVSPQGW